MIHLKIILFIIAFFQTTNSLQSADLCIKYDIYSKCIGQLNYSCNNNLCASKKEYCEMFYNVQYLVTIGNL
jgi:hypothetical protein